MSTMKVGVLGPVMMSWASQIQPYTPQVSASACSCAAPGLDNDRPHGCHICEAILLSPDQSALKRSTSCALFSAEKPENIHTIPLSSRTRSKSRLIDLVDLAKRELRGDTVNLQAFKQLKTARLDLEINGETWSRLSPVSAVITQRSIGPMGNEINSNENTLRRSEFVRLVSLELANLRTHSFFSFRVRCDRQLCLSHSCISPRQKSSLSICRTSDYARPSSTSSG